jgi:hypothetical protein
MEPEPWSGEFTTRSGLARFLDLVGRDGLY